MARPKPKLTDEDFYALFTKQTKRELKDTDKDLIDNIEVSFPDPEEFKRKLIRFNDVIKQVGTISIKDYINAVYFCTLYAQTGSQLKAYEKVFPERVMEKLARNNSTLHNSASAYFHGTLVQAVWKQVNIADHMIFMDTRFQAYQVLTDIMNNPKTANRERIEAAGKLATLLKPPKEAEVKINVNYQSKEIAALEERLGMIADQQLKQIQDKTINAIDIVEADIVEKDDDDNE